MQNLSLIHLTSPARRGSPPHPALILLHGIGAEEGQLMSLAPEMPPELFIIAARAPFDHPYGGYSWYDLEGQGPALGGPDIQKALDLLLAFAGEIVDAYPIDPQRIYFGGFSQGAAMSGGMALLHPDVIAGAIMLSGYLPPDSESRYRLQEAGGHPFFQTHGTDDETIPLEYAHQTRDFLSTAHVKLTYKEYSIGHEVVGEELADLRSWMSEFL
ncbi:MAG: alpha/beta hydrolase [Chloroflexota bacterium]